MLRTCMGFDGEYTIMGENEIEHRRRDGSISHYMSAFEIRDLSDRMKVEKILREEKAKKASPFARR